MIEIVWILFLLVALSLVLYCGLVIAGAVVLVLWDGWIYPMIDGAFISPLRERSKADENTAETQRRNDQQNTPSA